MKVPAEAQTPLEELLLEGLLDELPDELLPEEELLRELALAELPLDELLAAGELPVEALLEPAELLLRIELVLEELLPQRMALELPVLEGELLQNLEPDEAPLDEGEPVPVEAELKTAALVPPSRSFT